MPKKFWTKELIKEVEQLYRQHRSLSKVVEIFNNKHNTHVTTRALSAMISYNKVSIRVRWTEELLDDLQQIHLSVGSYIKTAELFNNKHNTSVTPNVVEFQLVAKRKGTRTQHHYSDEQIDFLKNSEDWSTPKLTELFNKEFGTTLTKKQIGDARYYFGVRRLSTDEVGESKKNGIWFVSVPKTHPHFDKLYKYRNDKYKKTKDHYRIYVRRSIYNWIVAGNELPDNYVLMKINGNIEDDTISNLRLATYNEALSVHARFRNIGGLKNVPTELVDMLLTVKQLDTAVKERLK